MKRPIANHYGGCSQMLVDGRQRMHGVSFCLAGGFLFPSFEKIFHGRHVLILPGCFLPAAQQPINHLLPVLIRNINFNGLGSLALLQLTLPSQCTSLAVLDAKMMNQWMSLPNRIGMGKCCCAWHGCDKHLLHEHACACECDWSLCLRAVRQWGACVQHGKG